MNPPNLTHSSHEVRRTPWNGWLMLAVNVAIGLVSIATVLRSTGAFDAGRDSLPLALAGITGTVLAVILCLGYFTLQPNEARVLILFGSYCGTVRESGFFWANPFYARVRARIP
jgi:hypothetical protein